MKDDEGVHRPTGGLSVPVSCLSTNFLRSSSRRLSLEIIGIVIPSAEDLKSEKPGPFQLHNFHGWRGTASSE